MKVNHLMRILFDLLVRRAPFDGQVIVTRRCNLRCGYCSEFDRTSPLIPAEELHARIDALHRLGVVHITFLGGEPLLHPHIADVVRHAHRRSVVSITTNGRLLSRKIVQELNAAGLDHMQISIDAVEPDPAHYIFKSLRPLRPRLVELKSTARFDIHLAAVLCERSAGHVKQLLHEADDLGIPISLSVVHDHTGRTCISGEPYVSLWEYYRRRENHFGFSMIDGDYSACLLRNQNPQWKCRAGSRYLYVDEFGMVQYCSMQRGRLNIPLERYSWNDVRRCGRMQKGCERGCANDCVFRASQIDNNRFGVLRVLLKSYFSNRRHRDPACPPHADDTIFPINADEPALSPVRS
jgi:MoaA/NifB/PqqE/SkfB family radical SAM enzyme